MSKFNDAESEAADTQTWLHLLWNAAIFPREVGQELYQIYHYIIGKLINMIINPNPWVLKRSRGSGGAEERGAEGRLVIW